MSSNRIFWILAISLAFILFAGSLVFTAFYLINTNFHPDSAPIQTLDSNLIDTAVAQTIEAESTKQATEFTPTSTSSLEPTATETPTSLPAPETSVPTNISLPPTLIVPTSTPVTTVCNRAQFVRDLSVQDNSLIPPGTSFVKTWRLKNIGHCTWNTNYSLVFHGGNAMDAKRSIPLPRSVEPNQTIDLSISMIAPQKEGTYRGDWMLSDPSGNRFGIGANGEQTIWVQVRVKSLVNSNLVYDFAGNYCRAEWNSAIGRLPCLGTSNSSEGFVILLDTPNLENRQEDELTLWTHPDNNSSGWISGTYPEFTIQPNHHFKAWVGCLDESKGCNIVFRLGFKNLKNGLVRTLGSWQEVYDGEITMIDLDLSQHAGKHVRFILTVEVNGGDQGRANGFWLVPGIVQSQSPTATQVPPTPTEVPTATPTSTQVPTGTPTPTQAPTETDTTEN